MWKSKFYGAFVLNHRVVLHAIDAMPARWGGEAGSSLLDRARTAASSPRNDLVKNCRVHPTHWLISTQVSGGRRVATLPEYQVIGEVALLENLQSKDGAFHQAARATVLAEPGSRSLAVWCTR